MTVLFLNMKIAVFLLFFISGGLSVQFDKNYQNEDHLLEIKSYYESFTKFLSKIQAGGTGLSEVLQTFETIFKTLQDEDYNVTNSNDDIMNLKICITDFQFIIQDTHDLKFDSLRCTDVWDSWAVPESGILEGNVRWPGHYYECLMAGDKKLSVRTRWCNSYLGYRLINPSFGIPVDISWGSCFPSSCSETSVQTILSLVLGEVQVLPPVLDVYCPGHSKHFSVTDIIGLIIVSILLIFVIIATVRDLYVNSNQDKSNFQSTTYWGKILDCFSIITNGRQILSLERKPGILPVLDGIRFLSTTWVILSHSLMLSLFAVDNGVFASQAIREHLVLLMPIVNGTFSVDSFFFLSGLLVVYLMLKHLNRNKGKINIPLMYLQRYLRLTPVYAFLILMSMGLMKYFGFGPFWDKFSTTAHKVCQDNWFTNLLFINNFYPIDSECFSWGWYLADDMQFYILAPFFVIILYKWPKIGLVTVGAAILGSIVLTGIFVDNYPPPGIFQSLQLTVLFRFAINNSADDPSFKEKYQTDIYHMPWYRFGTYGVGMLTGYVLYFTKRKIRLNKYVVVFCWCMSVGVALSIVYGIYGHIRDKTIIENENVSALYNAITRPLWAVCIGWLTVACSVGCGGPIKTFLDWRIFIPLSKLTYGAYLVHVLVIFWFLAIQDAPFHFSIINVIYLYLGTMVFSFSIAFIVALFVEWPFIGLLKLMFSGSNKKETKIIELENSDIQKSKITPNLGEINFSYTLEGTSF